jgi:hypothetical protein
VRVPLHDLAARSKGRVVEGVRELAEPASHSGKQAALPELAAGDITARPSSPAYLLPEAEQVRGGNGRAVQPPQRAAEVLNLPLLKRKLLRRGLGPEGRSNLAQYEVKRALR